MSQAHRIEVGFNSKNLDSVAISTENDITEDLEITDSLQIRFAEVYYLELGVTEQKAGEIAKKVIIDPLVQIFSLNKELYKGDFYVEVSLLDGVTDNLSIITKEAIEDFLGRKLPGKIRTSKKYYFSGKIAKKTIERIATQLLANQVIEKYEIGEIK